MESVNSFVTFSLWMASLGAPNMVYFEQIDPYVTRKPKMDKFVPEYQREKAPSMWSPLILGIRH